MDIENSERPGEDYTRRSFLEVEGQPEAATATLQMSRGFVLTRYFVLASLAVVATLTCPGETVLWKDYGVNSDGPPEETELRRAVLFSVIATAVLTLIGFLSVHHSDPGFLTLEMMQLSDRKDFKSDRTNEKLSLVENYCEFRIREKSLRAQIHDEKSIQLTEVDNGSRVPQRRMECAICQFAPPIRSHHCKECNRCVATFDHHCQLVGMCIGERNRCIFWWFLVAQFYGFVTCCHVVGSSKVGLISLIFFGDYSWNVCRVVLAKIYLYPLMVIAAVMLLLHSFFALCNTTTFECIKGHRHLDYLKGAQDTDFPFSRGLLSNLKSYGCYLHCPLFQLSDYQWRPTEWQLPDKIVRDSEDWWEHPWQNKYWSCC